VQWYRAAEGKRGEVYRVDPRESSLRILVYRGGQLARLGHNHVISSRDLNGYVLVATDVRASRADLYLPVRTLVVDDPAQRAAGGQDFTGRLAAADVEATRRHMLSQDVLDGARFPFVELKVRAVEGTPPEVHLSVELTVHGVTRHMSIPAHLKVGGRDLTASGQFRIRQSDFAITPYSALLGALQVQDTLRVAYALAAHRLANPGARDPGPP